MKRLSLLLTAVTFGALLFMSCGSGDGEEITLDAALNIQDGAGNEILQKTIYRPGPPEYEKGSGGGVWVDTINNDPKTFNTLTARDGDSRDIVDVLFVSLVDYDPYTRQFKPELASFVIEADEKADTLDVIYTLRDDLFWTTPDGSVKEKITSDDVVYWYDNIEGDKSLQLPAYPGQFIEMADGTSARVTIEKINDASFVFHFPRIVAEPILSTNMDFGPRYLFQKAKEEGGSEAILNFLSVDTDVMTIPSVGPYHIVEYTPGVRVVLKRNPWYHKKDEWGQALPYIETLIYRIVPDTNTEFLLFKDGTKDGYSLRPEDLDELINASNSDYSVYNGGEGLGSAFFSFNQNPDSMDPVKYEWFSKKEFRQAMSCLLNRPRIARQIYRGLAVPAHYFFAKANPMFDPGIKLNYTYDPERAVALLESVNIKKDSDGVMRDWEGRPLEFTINIGAENNMSIDIANIYADEMSRLGITANVRPIDFQKLVDMITNTYDWDCLSAALGANYWPSGGSNVWQSNGNFHLWRPLQETPATEWEARIDYLYNEGRFTLDEKERKVIYDEYQTILLEQLPMIYIVHPMSFFGIRDKWNNVFYDTLDGISLNHLYLNP
ncbi:MAG: ABC transporter substrate-binding protein [Spirochaetales bacterium]|nr:ABC transporter substrate-binding protein [Spirochaetales bacterium]